MWRIDVICFFSFRSAAFTIDRQRMRGRWAAPLMNVSAFFSVASLPTAARWPRYPALFTKPTESAMTFPFVPVVDRVTVLVCGRHEAISPHRDRETVGWTPAACSK